MAREKLGCIDDETVPQDLDLLEKEVMTLIDQQMKEAANAPLVRKATCVEAPIFENSKFAAANAHKQEQQRGKHSALSLFLRKQPQQRGKPENSHFLFASNNFVPEKKPHFVPGKFTAVQGASVSSQAVSIHFCPTALQQELGHIRHAKAHQYESVARLLKGLAQGDDIAEQYVVRHHPDLLKKLFKAPGH